MVKAAKTSSLLYLLEKDRNMSFIYSFSFYIVRTIVLQDLQIIGYWTRDYFLHWHPSVVFANENGNPESLFFSSKKLSLPALKKVLLEFSIEFENKSLIIRNHFPTVSVLSSNKEKVNWSVTNITNHTHMWIHDLAFGEKQPLQTTKMTRAHSQTSDEMHQTPSLKPHRRNKLTKTQKLIDEQQETDPIELHKNSGILRSHGL